MNYLILFFYVAVNQLAYFQSWTQVDIGNGILVKMPSSPTIRQIDSSKKSYGCLYGKCTFSILVSHVETDRLPKTSEDQKRILTLVLGIYNAKQDNTFISEKDFTLGKISGMEVSKFSDEIKDGKAKLIIRAFFNNGSLYQMTCLYYKGDDKDCDQARLTFFNSLSKQ